MEIESRKTGREYFQSGVDIFSFAVRQWKVLVGVAVVSGILAVVFSGPRFISPKYKSEAIIYPANLGGYSGETRLEQMQQYLQSNIIRDHLIQKFNLYEEYDIDSSKRTSRALINQLYGEHVHFDETQYESIHIEVFSTSPEKAKRMVDEILHQLNQVIRDTEREKYREIVVINENLLKIKKAHIDSLEKLVKKYNIEYGILDYLIQTEEVTKGYMKFLLEGKKGKDFEEVKELYDNLKKYGRQYHDLNVQLNLFQEEYVDRLHKYEHALKDYQKVLTHSYILVKPEVPDKKSYPIRWLIVVMAVGTSVVFTFVILLMLGYHKRT